MDGLKGMEIDQIEWAEHMPYPDVGLDTGKDIIMGELMNNAIEIEMQKAQRHQKPGSKTGIPPYQRQSYRYYVEPDRTHHNPEFLMILDPGMHHRPSSQCLLQKHT